MASGSHPTRGDRQTTHMQKAGTREKISDPLCNCLAEPRTATPIDQLNHVVEVDVHYDTHLRLSTAGWTLEELLRQGKRFLPVKRFPLKSAKKTIINFDETGVPCIIYDLHRHANWPEHYFQASWLKKHGPKEISVRNVYNLADRTMLLDDFIEQSRRTASKSASLKDKESLYSKDVKCPELWEGQLREAELIPSFLLPGDDEDLLPPQHVDTFKCHIGIGDTFTRCHQDLCASSGHDLMCYTEGNGSSFWFMTQGKDAPKALRYLEDLKRENGHEDHALTVQQLAKAPFTIYVAEQKLGDLVLIPPRSCHQVVNFGGLTIKTSWSRMVMKGLEAAYYHELPMYRRVCWPEKYRVKSLIYLNLLKRREALASLTSKSKDQASVMLQKNKQLLRSTEQLLKLFGSVLLEESPPRNRRLHCLQSSPDTPDSSNPSSTITLHFTCNFCGAYIFQSFFECLKCIPGPANSESSQVEHGEGIIICPGCYVEGRSCKCGDMDPIQCRPFQELLAVYNQVTESLSRLKANQILEYDNSIYSPAMRRTFKAACLLQNMREKSKGEERICSLCPSNAGSSWVLHCKKCRKGRCFPHILMSQKLHAVDAILINSSSSLHEESGFLQRYRKGKDHLLQTQQFGCKPDPTQQRVCLAEQYQRCRPVNPASVKAGWYDVYVEVLASNKKLDRDFIDVSQDSPLENVSCPLSSSTNLVSRSPLSELSDLTVSDAATPTLKRKRQVLDFVSVPNRPYKTRRISIAAGPDSSDLPEVVSSVQRQHVSSGPTAIVDSVGVVCGGRGQDQGMQVQSSGPPGVRPILRRDKLLSQSSASGSMASSLNPGTSTSPAAKGKRTARRVTEELDIPAPPTPPRSPTTSSRSTKSSQTQQSHVPESPARIDPESRQTLTDGGGTSKRRKSTHNEEPSRKRIIPEVPRRQSKSTVAGLAEALNTAAVSNHSAFYSADVDRLSDPTSSNNNVSEAGASASTSSAKTPLAHTGPLRSSAAVFGMVQERGQDVMQIDPRRSPSIDRHDHTPLQNPASPSETDVWHPASNNVNRDVVATTPSTKRRLRPTSPTPAVSLSPSSTSARSIHPTKHPQRQVVTPTQRGENNRRQASFSIPESPAPSSSTTIAKKSHQAASRGDTRSRQPPPSGPTSYEPETSSHGPLPAPGSTATESRSVHNVLDKQPPVPASATPSQNNAVPDAAPPSTSIDENPLNNAVEELQKAIHDSQHIPSRVVNAIVALADAMNKLVAQHPQNPQNLQNTHTISPTWPQGSHPSMFQQPYTRSPLWWGPEFQRYQQLLSQFRENFPYYPIPSFDEEFPNLWPPTPYDHFPPQFPHYDDGSRMRSGYSYGQRRYQPYREDFERRPDNRNHSFNRPRYNQQDRPPRPMWSDNTHHRGYPPNHGHFNSYRRTNSSEGRSMDGNSHHVNHVHPVGSASSPSSTLHPGGNDNRNSADKSMNRANPPPSSMTNQPRPSYPVDVASQPSVQQPGEGSSGQSSSHTAPPAELLPGRDRRPLTGRESGCEQRESAIDHDLSQEEHPTSSSMNLKHSLYENPWAC